MFSPISYFFHGLQPLRILVAKETLLWSVQSIIINRYKWVWMIRPKYGQNFIYYSKMSTIIQNFEQVTYEWSSLLGALHYQYIHYLVVKVGTSY